MKEIRNILNNTHKEIVDNILNGKGTYAQNTVVAANMAIMDLLSNRNVNIKERSNFYLKFIERGLI